MEFREYLSEAETVANGRQALAKLLDQNPDAITNAKAGKRGLPAYACVIIADLIGINPMEIIAASELVMEKNEKRKAIFRPFVEHARTGTLALAIILGTVTMIVTPTTAEALPVLKITSGTLCIMLSIYVASIARKITSFVPRMPCIAVRRFGFLG